jgi:hypothetical protein
VRSTQAASSDVDDWRTRYLSHDEITRLLFSWRDQFPQLLAMEALGPSPEGRAIWLATVHDKRCSAAESAPALWVDANIHATELAASAAALNLIWALLSPDASGPAKRVRERRTLYVVVRQNPDGAELALSSPAQLHRSRPDRRLHHGSDAFHAQDIDGDGRVLLMRVPDRNGWWCSFEREPRLLRPRLPHEDPDELECYNLCVEGMCLGTAVGGGPLGALDLNRNYPYHWRPEDEQPGAGPAPVSEPEIRSIIDAILDSRNIGAYLSYHTYGGVHLIPFGDFGELSPCDRERYRVLAKIAQATTGCPVWPTLPYWDAGAVYGTSDDWFYDHLGAMAWTTEFWNPLKVAGIDRSLPEYWTEWREEDELALLRWSDRAGDGQCFVDWYPFDHPQLGPVELGGWNQLNVANPPARLLPEVLGGHQQFAIAYALSLPQLEASITRVRQVGAEIWQIDVAVENVGWLPTTVTERAALRGLCGTVTCSLDHDGTISVIGGRTRDLGQLAGAPSPKGLLGDYLFPYGDASTRDERRIMTSFLAHGLGGNSVTISAAHDRAGRVSLQARLEDTVR